MLTQRSTPPGWRPPKHSAGTHLRKTRQLWQSFQLQLAFSKQQLIRCACFKDVTEAAVSLRWVCWVPHSKPGKWKSESWKFGQYKQPFGATTVALPCDWLRMTACRRTWRQQNGVAALPCACGQDTARGRKISKSPEKKSFATHLKNS